MKILLEELNTKLFRQSEVSGVGPLPVSKVLFPDEKMERRDADVTKFFEERSGFTYNDFKSIMSVSLGSIFGLGADANKKISKFAQAIDSEDEKGDVKIIYDEYVETFFIYLYYQLFVKLFSQQELIIAKNKEAIKNAKSILDKEVSAPLKEDMEEGIVKLYKSFYSMFASSMTDPSKIKANKNLQSQYFENFVNQNIRLFIDYPLSGFMKDMPSMKTKEFVGSMFDAVGAINIDDSSSRQIMTIRILSDFISGDSPDFDIVKFQELLKDYPAFTAGQAPIKFSSTLEPIVSNVIDELSSIEDIAEIGMEWAKGTKWESYIKILCGIVSLEGVSEKVKASAKSLRKEKSIYTKRLDIGEQDGGLYFINNQAFVAALDKTEGFKNVIDGLDLAIKNVAKKTAYFQSKKDKQLIESMFVKYDPTMAASYIKSLGDKEKDALESIMAMTNLIETFGSNFVNAVGEINLTLFRNTNEIRANLSRRNQEAVKMAMINVGDVELNPIRKDTFNAFGFTNTVQAIKDIGVKTGEFFTGVFKAPTDLENLKKSFNDAFTSEFDFAELTTDRNGKNVINMNGRTVFSFDDLEDFKTYVKDMCLSMGSILYHSKVCFGGPQQSPTSNKDQRYKEYFNVMSWFIDSLNKYGKGAAVNTTDYAFTYLVTPFLLEVVKYSFRSHVNEIEDILFEEDLIDKELRDQVKKSHKLDTMEDEDWKPIVEKLTGAIEEHLKKKATR